MPPILPLLLYPYSYPLPLYPFNPLIPCSFDPLPAVLLCSTEFTESFGKFLQTLFDAIIYSTFREGILIGLFTRRNAGQNFYSLIDGADGINVKGTGRYRIHDVVAQHQVFHVLTGDHDALRAGQTLRFAHIEKSFDLLVYASNGLNLAVLVDGSGYGNPLLDGNI